MMKLIEVISNRTAEAAASWFGVIHTVKEAGLQTLALTNRNCIQRPAEECKQAHHCKAHDQQFSAGRYSRSQ